MAVEHTSDTAMNKPSASLPHPHSDMRHLSLARLHIVARLLTPAAPKGIEEVTPSSSGHQRGLPPS